MPGSTVPDLDQLLREGAVTLLGMEYCVRVRACYNLKWKFVTEGRVSALIRSFGAIGSSVALMRAEWVNASTGLPGHS